MKKILIITVLYMLFYSSIYSQSIHGKNKFPNTNIGKEALNLYGGACYTPYSGNLSTYFSRTVGGIMSLAYFTDNNMAYFVSISGSDAKLKQNVSDIWQLGDSVSFYSFGLSVGYSLLNHVHWRITPFLGLPFLDLKPSKPTIKEVPELRQYKTGLTLSPEIGMNITYKFIKPQTYYNHSGTSGCFGLNMRISYLPFAVNQKNLPYHGGIWYLSIGVCGEFLNAYSNR